MGMNYILVGQVWISGRPFWFYETWFYLFAVDGKGFRRSLDTCKISHRKLR